MAVVPLFVRPDWYDRARCAGMGPERFYAERYSNQAEARQVCHGCEVRDQCLEHALTHPEPFGMWGGQSIRQRRTMRAHGVAS